MFQTVVLGPRGLEKKQKKTKTALYSCLGGT